MDICRQQVASMGSVKTSCLRSRYPSGSAGDVWLSSSLPHGSSPKIGKNLWQPKDPLSLVASLYQ